MTLKSRVFSCLAPEAIELSNRIVLSANSDWNIANFRSGLIRGLKEKGYAPVVIAPPDPAAECRMRALDVERIPVAIQRAGMNPVTDLNLFLNYRRLLKLLRPAAFLGFTIKPNVYGSLAAASLGVPALPNVSGLGTAFIRGGALEAFVTRLYRIGFRRAPVVFFQNEEDRGLFVERRIVSAEQGRVLPGSGVDLDRFSPAPLPDGPPVFLLIGRLLRDKGVTEFVEAARMLRSTHPTARFQLLGPIDDGNRTSIGRSDIDSWVAEGVVEYLGTTDDVRPFIAAASAIVLPSYREGLPRSLLEGAAMARPLIATDAPGCRDVVEDGVNGYLCEAKDAASLAVAMRRFAELPTAERLAMGNRARNGVQDRYSEKLVVDAYLAAIAEHQRGRTAR